MRRTKATVARLTIMVQIKCSEVKASQGETKQQSE